MVRKISVIFSYLLLISLGVGANQQYAKNLFEGAEKRVLESARELFDNGVDPNITDNLGNTPLHRAASRGHAKVVELFLNYGADLNIACILGYTPLHRAASNGFAKVVELLLNYGADPNVVSNLGFTPMHMAALKGYAHVVELLLNYGADPSIACSIGYTPLHRAAYEGHADVVKLLLEHGADPNIARKIGETPLHGASSEGHADVVELLLANGADPYIANKKGKFPKEVAKNNEVRELFELFDALEAKPETYEARMNRLRHIFSNSKVFITLEEKFKIGRIGELHSEIPREIWSLISEYLSQKDRSALASTSKEFSEKLLIRLLQGVPIYKVIVLMRNENLDTLSL